VMLFGEDPLARKVLLDALKQTSNPSARSAVCRALSQTRAAQKSIRNKEDFAQPLLQILSTDDSAGAKLAAEATLIFEYGQIMERLEAITANSSLSARLNAIYALELHPDIRAVIKLIELIEDTDGRVVTEAERALYSLGIQVGREAKTRKQAIDELKRKGPEVFLRNRLIRQEAEMRKLETELDLWQRRYLLALGRVYETISDDAAKGAFLAEHLGGTEAIVKLWALEKVYQWRVRPGATKLPGVIEPVLLNLISDQDRDVRLKTAKLLSLMGELNSAQPLLAQLEIDQDDEVRTELFVALGGACYYAFLSDSPFKIPEQIRKETLGWAAKYLSEQELRKAQAGAEVMKKMLEQNGLTPVEVDRYLGMLADKYIQQEYPSDGALRGELLSAMAGLCSQGSACKAKAGKLFKPLFEEALHDEMDRVREAAVDGLVYIDKAEVLKELRKDFVNDSSIIIRKKLIELAGEVGGKEDLAWLADKIGSNSESEPAWQTMLKIFNNSDAAVMDEWIGKFISQNGESKLSDGQKTAFLEIAERRAIAENKPEILQKIRKELADLYTEMGQFEQAAEYLGLLRETALNMEEKDEVLSDLLDVYLCWPRMELAATLVENCLLEKDLDPNNPLIRSIDNYMSNPGNGVDPNALLGALSKVEIRDATRDRPKWREQLKRWAGHIVKVDDSNEVEESGN